jgi:hypothetical protein
MLVSFRGGVRFPKAALPVFILPSKVMASNGWMAHFRCSDQGEPFVPYVRGHFRVMRG